MKKRFTTDEFIARARLVHGGKYDYSKTTYVHNELRVIIECPVHGAFEQKARSHYNGHGCRACVDDRNRNLNPNWQGYEEIPMTYWNQAKNGATKRGFSFNITLEYAWDVFLRQNRLCSFTGRPLEMLSYRNGKRFSTASLDRIDSSKGYEVGNIQWVHKDIQRLKSNWSDAQLIKLCKEIVAYQQKHERAI